MTKSVAKFILEAAGARLLGRTFAAGAVAAIGSLFQAGAPLALGRAVDLFGRGDVDGATLSVFVYVALLGAARLAPAIATPFTMSVERRLVHTISHEGHAHALDLALWLSSDAPDRRARPHGHRRRQRLPLSALDDHGPAAHGWSRSSRRRASCCISSTPPCSPPMSAFVAVYGVTFSLSMKGHRQTALHAHEQDGKASNLFVESLLNFETVKAFVAERAVMARLADLFGEAERRWLAHFSHAARNQIALTIVFTLSFGAIFALAVRRLQSGGPASDLLIVALYLAQVIRPIEHFTMVWRELIRSSAQVERMLVILSEETEAQRAAGGADLPGDGPLSLRVEGLWHSHHPGRPTLRDVSFALPPGKTLAVVGPSGGGKSTLARLLFRFHEPERGAIFVDGVAIEELDLRALRGALALVPQDCVLFNETLVDNLRFARPEATRAEIEEAMRAAGLDEVLARLPQGEETIVGERGLRLSGGEKQRVAIARALLKRPRLLVLDEATSSLDTRTERLIQERIASVSAGVTRVIVAHRLSTIVDADEIIVLEEGAIVERGAHDALLAADGRYAQMWAAQRREDAQAALEPEPA